MRSVRMPGNIEIIYARDPDFFKGVRVLGKQNKVMAITINDRLVLSMTISIKPMYVNKKIVNMGYISSLRLAEDARNGMIGGISYKFFKRIHDPALCPAYVSSIIDSNVHAKKILLREKDYFIKNRNLGKYVTYAIILNKKKKRIKPVTGITVMKGNEIPLEEIVRFLNNTGRKKQFFPVYETGDFHSPYLMDFSPDDFYIAKRNGTIAGVIGKWDQQEYKKNIIHGYHGILKTARAWINRILSLTGYHPLPGPGETLRYFHAGFICIEQDRADILRLLLDHVMADSLPLHYHLCMTGFHEKDPLREAMRYYFSIPYISHLYCFFFKEGMDFINSLDRSLIPYLEGAAL